MLLRFQIPSTNLKLLVKRKERKKKLDKCSFLMHASAYFPFFFFLNLYAIEILYNNTLLRLFRTIVAPLYLHFSPPREQTTLFSFIESFACFTNREFVRLLFFFSITLTHDLKKKWKKETERREKRLIVPFNFIFRVYSQWLQKLWIINLWKWHFINIKRRSLSFEVLYHCHSCSLLSN